MSGNINNEPLTIFEHFGCVIGIFGFNDERDIPYIHTRYLTIIAVLLWLLAIVEHKIPNA